jgi:hypothetical protein
LRKEEEETQDQNPQAEEEAETRSAQKEEEMICLGGTQ